MLSFIHGSPVICTCKVLINSKVDMENMDTLSEETAMILSLPQTKKDGGLIASSQSISKGGCTAVELKSLCMLPFGLGQSERPCEGATTRTEINKMVVASLAFISLILPAFCAKSQSQTTSQSWQDGKQSLKS